MYARFELTPRQSLRKVALWAAPMSAPTQSEPRFECIERTDYESTPKNPDRYGGHLSCIFAWCPLRSGGARDGSGTCDSYSQTVARATHQRRESLWRAPRQSISFHHRRDRKPAHDFRRGQLALRAKAGSGFGRITGILKTPGEYKVMLHAKNSLGEARRDLKSLSVQPSVSRRQWAGTVGIVSDLP